MKTLLCVLFTCVLSGSAFTQTMDNAQQKTRYKKSYWFDLGAGWGGQGGAFNMGISYEIVRGKFLSLRYSNVLTNHRCEEYLLFIPVGDHPIGHDADSYELFFGILKKKKYGLMNFSAGLSVVKVGTGTGDGTAQGTTVIYTSNCPVNYTFNLENTIGISLRAQFLPSIKWVGFGVSPYINVTPKYTYASITFNLALGRLKPKTI
jgi:hypothetical protein